MANNASLKEIICDNLARSLSDEKYVHENAEQQLVMLETNEDYGLLLLEISLTENIEFPIRHLASVLLNGYVTKHWSESSEKFEPPEVTPTMKQLIRDFLLKSLVISTDDAYENIPVTIRKLLSSYAHVISNIAQHDWPDQWPQLFPVLNQNLNTRSSQGVIYSSLRILTELAHEISNIQIPVVAPILLPQVLNIFATKSFPSVTRTHAIKTFGNITEIILLMNEKPAIKQYLGPLIPKFMESAIQILDINSQNENVSIGMKKEIISILIKFFRYCRVHIKPYLQKILGLIWQNLTASAPIHVKFKVNSFSCYDLDDSLEESVDSDGELSGLESFIYTIIEFVSSAIEFPKYRVLIKPVLTELLYYILFYMQITDEQMESWQTDLDKLIDEDEGNTSAYSVRIAAQELIMNLSRYMTTVGEKAQKKDDDLFKVAFLHAIQRHFNEASELEKTQKSNGIEPQTWWKIAESCIYAMGTIAQTIIYTIKNGKAGADEYKVILDNVLLNLNISEPFVAGRSLWTASRFAEIMNDQSLDNFFKFTSTLLNTTEAPILRVFALRASFYFFEHVQVYQKVTIIKPYLQQFLQGLVSIGLECNSDTLYLVLTIIQILLSFDLEFASNVSSNICSLSLSAMFRFPYDATLFDVVLNILDKLFSINQCLPEMQERILPVIIAILNAQSDDPSLGSFSGKIISQNITTMQPYMMNILTKMINRSERLNDVMIHKAYPVMINCTSKASKEDSAIFQEGTDCLSAFLKKGAESLIQYVDPVTNYNGIFLALNFCVNLLNPQISDSASAYVGRVIVNLIMKSNRILGHENIQHLLRSTLVRLNSSQELLIMQSLILVFAHLLYTDLHTILVFLHSLPAPDGTRSALVFVLDKWLGIQRYFHGYENKASTVALCRLFQHALQYQNENSNGGTIKDDLSYINLSEIQVSCDDEFDQDSQTARTRSRTAGTIQKRLVPCTIKILKLLINEMSHINELKAQSLDNNSSGEDEEDDFDEDEDEDDEENIQENMGNGQKKMIDLTDLLTEGELEDAEDEDEILCEEIGNLDLENVLRTFLCEFRSLPISRNFLCHLTPKESQLLQQL